MTWFALNNFCVIMKNAFRKISKYVYKKAALVSGKSILKPQLCDVQQYTQKPTTIPHTFPKNVLVISAKSFVSKAIWAFMNNLMCLIHIFVKLY